MAESAQVTSLDALSDFRSALLAFGESGTAALTAVALETQRFVDWLEQDQLRFWQAEITRREEKMNEAKSALNRKRLAATFGDPPRDSEELHMLKIAVRKLEEAQEKIKIIQKWRNIVDRAVTEYQGQSQLMANYLEGDLPRAIATLEKTIAKLEEYLDVARPDGREGSVTSAPLSVTQSAARPVDQQPAPQITEADAPAPRPPAPPEPAESAAESAE